MSTPFDAAIHCRPTKAEADQVHGILTRMNRKMQQDQLVQATTDDLRQSLQADRVLLYYFYRQWEGQVTFESLSDRRFSILGSKGPDQCFTDEYANLYLAGRVRAIADIMNEPIDICHRDFLGYLQVRANLVVPILVNQGLWGLLIAHHCQNTHSWSAVEIEQMGAGAKALAVAPAIAAE